MTRLISILLFVLSANVVLAQAGSDSLHNAKLGAAADDPTQFLTRLEVFNNLQYFDNNSSFNQSVVRFNAKLGKRFTTRIDLPYVYNSTGNGKSGLGDISVRLLGYKIIESPLQGLAASIELSMNTAAFSSLGTGKNILVPLLSYSRVFPAKRMTLSAVFEQANSVGGDTARKKISYSKLQIVMIKRWSPKMWTTAAPEFFLDYVGGNFSGNFELRTAYAPAQRFNLWLQGGLGMFGDFIARYQWSVEIGTRYFFLRKPAAHHK